jgi:hypothetical protein
MADVLAAIERDWPGWAGSAEATAALGRWRAAGITDAPDMDALVAALQDRTDPMGARALAEALAGLARGEPAARRVLLQAARPGLVAAARRRAGTLGAEDAAAWAVAAAWARLCSPGPGARHPGALVGAAGGRLHRLAAAEARHRGALVPGVGPEPPERAEPHPGAEVVSLVAAAVGAGALGRAEAALVLAHRVAGLPTGRLAAERGLAPGTLRLHRRRAEARLAAWARAEAGGTA